MDNKYFNVTEHERKEKRKEILATTFVWSVLGFAAIGVLATFSLAELAQTQHKKVAFWNVMKAF